MKKCSVETIGLKPDALYGKVYDWLLKRRTLEWFFLGLQGAGGCMLPIPTTNAALRGIMTIVAHTTLGVDRLQGDRCTDHRAWLTTMGNAAWKSNCHGDVKAVNEKSISERIGSDWWAVKEWSWENSTPVAFYLFSNLYSITRYGIPSSQWRQQPC